MDIIEIPEDNSMDIYSEKGTKIIFTASGGWDYDKTNAEKRGLILGEKYTVEKTKIGTWFSFVELEEFPNLEFNTMLFDKI